LSGYSKAGAQAIVIPRRNWLASFPYNAKDAFKQSEEAEEGRRELESKRLR